MLKRPEQLPEAIEKALGGLRADARLKSRIEFALLAKDNKSEHVKSRVRGGFVPRRVVPVAAAFAVAVFAVAGVISYRHYNGGDAGVIANIAAGETEEAPAVEEATERPIESLPSNVASVNDAIKQVSYRSIWAPAAKSNFPIIGVNGRYYRELTSPSALPGSVGVEKVGTVTKYAEEPFISDNAPVVSNTVPVGTDIYEVNGMGGTFIAADTGSGRRVYQRVSINNSGAVNGEKLADTAQIAGHIKKVSLSNVGVIEDAAKAEEFFRGVAADAIFNDNGELTGGQSMIFTLDNGLSLQFVVKENKMHACGTWSVPDLQERFKNAM